MSAPPPDRPREIGQLAWFIGVQAAALLLLLAGTRILTGAVAPELFGRYSLCLLLNQLVGSALGQGTLQDALARVAAGATSRPGISLAFFHGGLAAAALAAAIALAIAGTGPAGWLVAGLCLIWQLADFRLRLETALLNATRRQTAFAIWSALPGPACLWASTGLALLCGPRIEVLVLGAAAAALLLYGVRRLLAGPTRIPVPESGRERPGPGVGTLIALVPCAGLVWSLTAGERYLLAALGGWDAAGIYAAGYGLVTRPILVFCNNIALPLLRPGYYARQAADAVAAGCWLRHRSLLALAAILVGVACLTALLPWVLPLLLAPAYHSCAAIIPWLGLAYAGWAMVLLAELPLLAHGRQARLLPVYACGALIQAVAVTAGAWWGGALGTALGVLVGMTATLASMLIAGRRR